MDEEGGTIELTRVRIAINCLYKMNADGPMSEPYP